jgi:hypothetical protein
MDLLRIAARVASVRTAVPEGMGDQEIRSAIETALQSAKSGQPAGIEIPSMAEELRESEYFANVSVEDGSVRIFSTVHHDTGLVYEAPLESFDLDAATAELASDIKAGLEQFNEMFPEEPEEDPGPPSDPGPGYDTLEEKKGLR